MTTETAPDFALGTYRLLAAFHAGMLLKRTPTPATPDGHRKFFTLDQLVLEGRIAAGSDLCDLAREARRMTRKGLLTHRRLYGRDYWMMTPDGAHVLRTEVRQHGLTGTLDAALAVEQADYDARQAARAAAEARIRFEAACEGFGERLPSEDALLFAALNGRAAQ
jgi:hypothetical protein